MAKERSFANAVKWAYAANWGEKGLSSVFAIVLAGMLGPAAFGMVAVAIVYTSILQMFLDQGFVAALIQRKDLQSEHLDAVFWMDQLLAVVLLLLSIPLAGWWATRNHAPEAAGLISVMTLDIPLMALSIVQSAVLRREMDFKSLSICANVSSLIGGLTGLGMAVAGLHAWSLVGQQLGKDAVNIILLWTFSRWRPRFEFSWRHLMQLTDFSVKHFIAQLGILADMQASSIILGLYFGPVALGLYRIADRIMNSVVYVATSAVQSVSLPEFSRLQQKPDELRKSVLTCLHLTSSITVPALCGLAVVSTPLMGTIGKSWTPAGRSLQVLCLLGVALVFAYFTGPLLSALSRTKEIAILEWVRMAIGVAVLIPAAMIVRTHSITTQIMGIALARFATGALIVAPFFLFIVMKTCRISMREFVVLAAPSVASAGAIVISVLLLVSTGLLHSTAPIFQLTCEVAVGGSVGLTALLAFDKPLKRAVAGIVSRSYYRLLAAKQSA